MLTFPDFFLQKSKTCLQDVKQSYHFVKFFDDMRIWQISRKYLFSRKFLVKICVRREHSQVSRKIFSVKKKIAKTKYATTLAAL
jgi:hypothetical protein